MNMFTVPPLFRCAWDRALFIHYEADPGILQRQVPFELDLFGGRACVSLVAFTLRGMRFARGGPGFATHPFLNVRTYVRGRGIFFLAEWLTHPLCVFLGPRLYGLPYRRGRFDYRHDHERGEIRGTVAGAGALEYRATVDPRARYGPCAPGGLDEFLLERYTAFTERRGARRLFRVAHPLWPQVPVAVTVVNDSLIATTGAWFGTARLIGGNYSPGFENVQMGRPEVIA